MDIYKDRIRPLFDKSGLQDKQIEQILELPRGVIYKWGTGKYKSYKTYLPQIASYFHVSTDYLLGNTDDPRPTGKKEQPALVPESRPLYPPEYDLLSPEDRTLVDNMIRSLAKKKSSD